jgi:hypothetical protein
MKSSTVLLTAVLVVVCMWCLPVAASSDVVDRSMQAYDDLGSFSVKLSYSVRMNVGQSFGTHSFEVDVWQSSDYMRTTIADASVDTSQSGGFRHSNEYTTVVTDIAQGIDHCLSPQGEWTTRKAQCLHLLDILLLTSVDAFDSIQEAEWSSVPVWILTASESTVAVTYYVDRTSYFLRQVTMEIGSSDSGIGIVCDILVGLPQSGVPHGIFDLSTIV